jgi:transcription antitermination protein NusB
MSNRHLARSIAMQTLYQWDFKDRPTAALPAILDQNIEEFGVGIDEDNKKFAEITINGVIEKLSKIDKKIEEFAPNWPLDQMSMVDRNILRIGTFELYWNDAIPAKVAINEAIEIAKSYGGQSSGKFVNGILGAMYNDLNRNEETEK